MGVSSSSRRKVFGHKNGCSYVCVRNKQSNSKHNHSEIVHISHTTEITPNDLYSRASEFLRSGNQYYPSFR